MEYQTLVEQVRVSSSSNPNMEVQESKVKALISENKVKRVVVETVTEDGFESKSEKVIENGEVGVVSEVVQTESVVRDGVVVESKVEDGYESKRDNEVKNGLCEVHEGVVLAGDGEVGEGKDGVVTEISSLDVIQEVPGLDDSGVEKGGVSCEVSKVKGGVEMLEEEDNDKDAEGDSDGEEQLSGDDDGKKYGDEGTRDEKKFDETRVPLFEMTTDSSEGEEEEDKGEGEREGKEKVNKGGEDDDEEEEEEDDDEEGEEDEFEEDEDMGNIENQGHGFEVGDFVWGKVRSHPWWPGQIYDPSDASKKAVRYKRKDRLLVAYFGDGTFAWCYPSQLKPFQENYEHMVNQSISKTFLSAVDEVVEAVGRCVELEMTCCCVRAKDLTRFNNLLATNSGIREGVFMPDGGIGEFSIDQFDSARFIRSLHDKAQVVSVTDKLELAAMKSQLSAFYFAKGYSHMPYFYEPVRITDLDDITKTDLAVADPNLSALAEDWISSPAGGTLSSSQKWPGIAEDKLYQRKKQRRISDLMDDDMDVELDGHSLSDEELVVKPKSASSKRKKKDPDFDEDSVDKKPTRTKRSGSSPSAAGNKSSKKHGAPKKVNTVSSSSREIKKSKYVSSPYFDAKPTHKSADFTNEVEVEATRKSSGSSLGERIKKVAGQFKGTPQLMKCDSSVKSPVKMSKDPSTPSTKDVVLEESVHPRKLLSDFRSPASDPLHVTEDQSPEMLVDFFTKLRSSSNSDGSDSSDYKSALAGEGTNGHDKKLVTFPGKAVGKKRKGKELAATENPKKKDSKLTNNGNTPTGGAALLMTFYQGESLPSKNDLIAVFRKFGDVDESETGMMTDSSVARVVFTKSSDAEQAYRISEEENPFHKSIISYRIRYAAPSGVVGSGSPSLSFIKQSLESTSSILEKSWDKLPATAKTNFEIVVKELLQKVNSTAEAFSS